MGIDLYGFPYGLPGATIQAIEIEKQENNNGTAGYGPFIRPEGRFLRQNQEDTPFSYSNPEVGDMKAYSTVKVTYKNGSSRTYTMTPFGTVTESESGDVAGARGVASREVMNPFTAEEIISAANYSGTWVTAMGGAGTGDISIPANDPNVAGTRLTFGTKVYGSSAGIYFTNVVTSTDPGFSCRVKKTRFRIKYAAHGGVGGGIRLKILKHHFNPGTEKSISSAFVMHGLSDYPTGTVRNGTFLTDWNWSYTIGKVGQIVNPTISGPAIATNHTGPGLRTIINTRADSTKLDNPALFMMFAGSSIETRNIVIPFDHDKIGDFVYTAWEEIPASSYDMTFYIFMFDYPARGL